MTNNNINNDINNNAIENNFYAELGRLLLNTLGTMNFRS